MGLPHGYLPKLPSIMLALLSLIIFKETIYYPTITLSFVNFVFHEERCVKFCLPKIKYYFFKNK